MDEQYKALLEQNKLYEKLLKSIPGFLSYKTLKGEYEFVSDQETAKILKSENAQKALDYAKRIDLEVIDLQAPVKSVFEMETDDGLVTIDSTKTPIFDDNDNLIGIASMNRNIDDFIEMSKRITQITAIQTAINDISKMFVGINPNNQDELMNYSIKRLGEAISADRAYTYMYNFSENTMDNTHEWCNEGVTPEINNLKGIPITYYLEGWVNVHRNNKPLIINDLQQENHDSNIYKVLNPQGVKSLLSLPIFVENECVGHFGFESVFSIQDWSGIIEFFSIIPQMYSSMFAQSRIQRELDIAIEKAKEASTIQTDFIARVTHELRTPINGVSNALYLLQDSSLDEDQIKHVEIMDYSLEVLTGLVDNILDYTKIDKNELTYNPKEVNLESEIVKLIKVNKYMAKNKGLGLYLNYDYSIPSLLSTDIDKLRQILNNLIVNAIKYTNNGQVEIKVTALNSEHPYTDVKFEIIDTGIGISQENQNRIVEEFYQVGDDLAENPQGTGLGLKITTEFIKLLKTELQIESTERVGSNFSFDLKLFSPNPPIQKEQYEKNVLVVDLSEGIHSNVIGFLKSHFTKVETCTERNCRLAIKEDFDTVIVYTNDPVTYPSKLSSIHSVITKAGSRMKKALLYDGVKSKGFVDSFDLFNCTIEFPHASEMFIERLKKNNKPKEPVLKIVDQVKAVERKILLVDDNNINRRVMGKVLSSMNLEVTEAKDGFEAIELVKNNDFNIVFMDIFMPRMNGYETSKKIREIPGSRGSIPIIAVTANDLAETNEKVLENGMNGVLTKPLRKEELEKLIDEYFTPQSKENELTVFDAKAFEGVYEDVAFQKEILETFFDSKEEDLINIIESFKTKDCDLIHKALHYMKGSFKYLRAMRILEVTQLILDYTDANNISASLLLKDQFLNEFDILFKTLDSYYKTL